MKTKKEMDKTLQRLVDLDIQRLRKEKRETLQTVGKFLWMSAWMWLGIFVAIKFGNLYFSGK